MVLATGVFASLQEQKKAEEEYKNIQVFKGVPAKEILPAMQFMSASLGVDCDFCHEERNFAGEGKHEKQAARHMVEMTREINAKNFGGSNEVTCATCHNGKSHPAGSPSLPGVTPTTNRTRANGGSAADITSKYITAIGGADKVAALKNLHLTMAVSGANGAPTIVEVYQAAPNKFYQVAKAANGDVRTGYNGVVTWQQGGGRTGELVDSRATRAQHIGRFFRGEGSMPKYDQLTLVGTEKIGDQTENVVVGTLKDAGIRERMYFNADTGLLDRVVYSMHTILGELPEVYDFSDYRDVEGVKIPFRIVQTAANGKMTRVVSSAQANEAVKDSDFDMPKA